MGTAATPSKADIAAGRRIEGVERSDGRGLAGLPERRCQSPAERLGGLQGKLDDRIRAPSVGRLEDIAGIQESQFVSDASGGHFQIPHELVIFNFEDR
jgi:hypothetical protein